MEGKAVLFKKFAGIDVFDIEVNEKNLDKLVGRHRRAGADFGGINLEDIKAPDCFTSSAARERMKIPVFHDDQHGTAIVVGAAVLNALKVAARTSRRSSWSPRAPAPRRCACLGLLVKLGLPRENIWVTDLAGVVYEGRTELMDDDKAVFAQKTSQRTLAEVMPAPTSSSACRRAASSEAGDGRASMAPRPADPGAGQPDAGDHAGGRQGRARRRDHRHRRTDYPNQVNNVLCFPVHLPRRARLGRDDDHRRDGDRRVHAIAELAQAEQNEVVAAAASARTLSFGPGT